MVGTAPAGSGRLGDSGGGGHLYGLVIYNEGDRGGHEDLEPRGVVPVYRLEFRSAPTG